MGSGPYGSNTIFLPTIAYGPNPGYTPATVTALTENGTVVTNHRPVSTGNNLSDVTGPCIFYTNGGQAAAPPDGPKPPALAVAEDGPYNAGLITQQTLFSPAAPSPVASPRAVVVLTQAAPLTA